MHVDLGTGDASLPYRLARRNPDRLYIGVDATAERMLATARRAARKPAKGGAPNLLLVQAHVQALPCQLQGIANHVTVYLPWSSLLLAALGIDLEGLRGIASVCRGDATVQCVLSHDPERDGLLDDVPPLTRRWLEQDVAARYRVAGLRLTRVEPLHTEQLRTLPTTWAKRLGFGAPRTIWRLHAKKLDAVS